MCNKWCRHIVVSYVLTLNRNFCNDTWGSVHQTLKDVNALMTNWADVEGRIMQKAINAWRCESGPPCVGKTRA